jgi:epoxyqueuosine reductase
MEKVDTLTNNLFKLNAKFKIISVEHIIELKEDIEQLYNKEKITKQIYNYISKYYQFDFSKDDLIPRYIIIIAIPQKITIISFQIKGKKVDAIIPPSYIYGENRERIYNILLNIFKDPKQISLANLPKKLLAVRSGLAKYGKNNISYVEGMGSFHRLESFYIDYPIDIDNWNEKIMMDQCNNCSVCINTCPNNCISNQEFVINAGNCLTYFNENTNDFPDWLDIKSHNALVGCMKCQIVCPVNRDYIKNKEKGITFSAKESEIIMQGLQDSSFPSKVMEKLKMINMDEYISVLPRNISVLMK